MGHNLATELAEGTLGLDLESAIGMHLRGNHYPPVPLSMVQPCIDAIDAYWEEDIEKHIELPEGVSWRGNDYAPAWALIEGHHLEAWCQDDFVDEDYE
jgi:hypothetical protein